MAKYPRVEHQEGRFGAIARDCSSRGVHRRLLGKSTYVGGRGGGGGENTEYDLELRTTKIHEPCEDFSICSEVKILFFLHKMKWRTRNDSKIGREI